MAILVNQSKNKKIIDQLRVAESFLSRSKGLIGYKVLSEKEGVLLPRCFWIHTFFMSIPIDVIYLDKKMRVKKLQSEVLPWRCPLPVFRAHSVIELAAGSIKSKKIEIGDLIYVGS